MSQGNQLFPVYLLSESHFLNRQRLVRSSVNLLAGADIILKTVKQ